MAVASEETRLAIVEHEVQVINRRLNTELVTKVDLAEFGAELRTEMGEMRTALRTEMGEMRVDLRTEMGEVRVDLREDNAKHDAALRVDMAEMRADLRTEMANMRVELIKWVLATPAIYMGVIYGGLKLLDWLKAAGYVGQ